MTHKLWGGCFTSATNPHLEKLNSSIGLDKRLYREDIAGSQAYAKTLCSTGLLSRPETDAICKGLDNIELEWSNNSFVIKNGDEDIHTANERRLKELIGEPATKLHVGRSRNDQVATDMKLWLKSALLKTDKAIKNVVEVMVERARTEIDILMPGYTHMQRAQPVRWSHWILSHAWNLKNDSDRLQDILKRTNIMPLGSGALAGNPFNIDRNKLARRLGFDGISNNSMQAVGDRDFVAEFLFWASLTGVHLTRLAEDLIIYSSKEFNFVQIHDSFSTGSSLMPQKRNPDSLELIRGIGSSLFGQCCSFMMVLKSLPTTYNKDLQTDKELMFSTYDKLTAILEVTHGSVQSLKVNIINCQNALSLDMLATDVAYYLVRKSVPFREAHHLAGEVVAAAEAKKVEMKDLSLEELKLISVHFEADVTNVWNYENSVEQYKTAGGTSKSSIWEQIRNLDYWLGNSNEIL